VLTKKAFAASSLAARLRLPYPRSNVRFGNVIGRFYQHGPEAAPSLNLAGRAALLFWACG